MKEITILTLHLGFGGIEKYVSSLSAMLKDEYKIKIISTYRVLDTPPFNFDGVEIEYLTNLKPTKEELIASIKEKNIKNIIKYTYLNIKTLFLKYFKNIVAIRKINSDYIITTRDFHNILVGMFAKKEVIKIATEHNHHNNEINYITKIVKSVKKFDYFVLVSNELKQFYSPLVKPTVCKHIPNVIEKSSEKPNKLGNFNLISIGRIEKVKGFDDLILIMEQLVKINKKYHLDLIGDGTEFENIKKLINEKKLEKNITMHGFLSHEQINKVIKDESLYVMTSHSESFGIVLIEAMSYGIPCVAFDSASGGVEVIKDKKLIIKDRKIKKMVKTIDELLNDKKRLKQLGKNVFNESNNYLSSNVKEDWKKILK